MRAFALGSRVTPATPSVPRLGATNWEEAPGGSSTQVDLLYAVFTLLLALAASVRVAIIDAKNLVRFFVVLAVYVVIMVAAWWLAARGVI